ncbi:hypothetical protein [Paenibacillus jilunlii]|uniref:Uncharacterized protein n=1 Tax=Paenibacillus jilunlii TaxID=682956 RepID=A0A1G9MPY7_9BACL|nr:hypothetical protein [Paenibacillus jilunlii]KWX70395.1 hypothetical protein AML91_25180 [Paenibacillus jilunlii]SDL76328.1 hypothetical protein SAMN05216191_105249 [Paenibacillus jilunlii]
MGSLIYVAAIIIIAIISGLNKAGKNKGSSAPRGGMPTFGGGDGYPLNPGRRVKSKPEYGGDTKERSGFPVPGGSTAYPGQPAASRAEAEYDASPAWPESSERPSPDYETGEGLSLEQAGEEDGVQARAERMQRELERLHLQFDGAAAGADPGKKGARPDSSPSGSREFAADRKALREGLVWAEILGPPRSRQPRSYRR